MISVDEFLAEQGIPRLDVLKIDAEGNDMAVITGAAQALNASVGLFTFEVRLRVGVLCALRTHINMVIVMPSCFDAHHKMHAFPAQQRQPCAQGNGVAFPQARIDALDAIGFSCYR